MRISFNKPLFLGTETDSVLSAIESNKLTDGAFNRKCSVWFKEHLQVKEAILTPSCTAALEMAMVLLGIQPGDEVILPSYTFTSSATSIVMFGGIPVFVDVHPGSMNINESCIEGAITERTKAIMPVHYAGSPCDMDTLEQIAEKHNLKIIADAAQAIGSTYKDRPLASFGHMSAISFHETKNITCGEGGVLCINDSTYIENAKIARDKGTDRAQFLDGMVDKYSWKAKGGSYLVSELQSAYLYPQLKKVQDVTKQRLHLWGRYHQSFEDLEKNGHIKRPALTLGTHNGHLYFIILKSPKQRDELHEYLKKKEILAIRHYVPLHNSDAGKKYGRMGSSLNVTEELSDRLLRLPLFFDLTEEMQDEVVLGVKSFFNNKK